MSVRVWHIAIDSPRLALERREAVLDAAERERAERFRFASDRKRFVAARTALRHILGEVTNAAPETVSFRTLPNGKLELQHGGSAWQFSVSHSGDRAVIALAWERRVGIDIELIARTWAQLRDVADTITQAERGEIDALEPQSAARKFYRLWVRKEALAKASGVGFSGRPQTPDRDSARWYVADLDDPEFISANYAAALAVEGEPARIVHLRWP